MITNANAQQFAESIPLEYSDFYQGSGGTSTGMVAWLSNYRRATGASIQVQREPENRLGMAVSDICSAFGLTKEELATLCDTTRKTLYNWIDGKVKPRKKSINRVFDLLVVAREWQHAGFSGASTSLHQAVLGEKSVFDLLQQPEIDKDRILFAGSRLTMMSPGGSIADPFV